MPINNLCEKEISRRILFIGAGGLLARSVLKALEVENQIVGIVQSFPAQPSWLHRLILYPVIKLSAASSLKTYAHQHQIPYCSLIRGSSEDALREFIRLVAPDIGCIATCCQLLSSETLAMPRLGFISIHPSMLPRLRGPNPLFWNFYYDDSSWGVTVHRVTRREDSGAILAQAEFTPPTFCRYKVALGMASRLGAHLMRSAVDSVLRGTARDTMQVGESGPRARRVKLGERFVDWDSWNLKRTYKFLLGTYSVYREFFNSDLKGMIQWIPIGISCRQTKYRPGTIHIDWRGFFVAHRLGAIRLFPVISLRSILVRLLVLKATPS